MKVTKQSRRHVRVQNIAFIVLFLSIIGLLAWLSQQYKLEADWTAGNRNTLSETSQELLATLEEPLTIIAFVDDNQELHQRIKERVAKYQRYKDDITLEFVNPDLDPERAKLEGITRSGQLKLRVGSRSENLDDMSEQTIANTLQRLVRGGERVIAFLEGHEERSPNDAANQGLQQLAGTLERGGYTIYPLNLIRTPAIADNISLLVIAGAQHALLEGEVKLIRDYVADGGNLLWLRDPGQAQGLDALAEDLGIRFLDGMVVDANQELHVLLGINHPAVIPIIDYPRHAISRELSVQTLFPFATAIETEAGGDWVHQPLLSTLPQTWSETGSLTGDNVVYEPEQGDRLGPLTIGVAITRTLESPAAQDEGAEDEQVADRPAKVEQRVVVIGDSDFLTNNFLGVGANLDLGANIFNWLSRDDKLIAIAPKTAPDTRLDLSENRGITIGIFFLFVLPLALLVFGVTIWFRRRKR